MVVLLQENIHAGFGPKCVSCRVMLVTKYRFYIAFAAFLLITCNRTPQEAVPKLAGKSDFEAILKRGYINALVDNNSVSFFIYKGHPMGYDYELLNLFANHLNVQLRVKVINGVDNAVRKLHNGEGDILAFPLSVTKERKEYLSFTRPHFNSYQVLVQRKPVDWRRLTAMQVDNSLIRNPADLIGKEVHILKNSAHRERLVNLSEETGGDIHILEDSAGAASESLIQKVAFGEIDYTVADHTMAAVNAAYYPNIDISTALSLPQQISWAVKKGSDELLNALDEWLVKIKKEPTFMVVYNRYYKNPRTALERMNSDYSSLGGNKLSPYDDLIKEGAKKLGWDWRLLAAVVYQESRFKPQDVSWAGAQGLMQIMPRTGKEFGLKNPYDPKQNIRVGVKYLIYLNNYWSRTIFNKEERLKFILASYNAGLTHVKDAQRLAEKYDKNPTVWDNNVEEFLAKKSDPAFYQDAMIRGGYCKCEEPIQYVKSILLRFEEYKIHIAT